MGKKTKRSNLNQVIAKYGTDKNKDGKVDAQNFVTKHSMNKSGAGAHTDKKGDKAPRARQKREWKKDMNETTQSNESLLSQIHETYSYENSGDFEKALKDIEGKFNINLMEQFTQQQHADMAKLIGYYMDKPGDVVDQIGNDLEQLEYQPDEIDEMLPHIMSRLDQQQQQ